MSYYYIKEGEIVGPAPLEELHGLCRRGEVSPDTQVCTEGAESWQPLSALGPIEPASPEEPPQAAAVQYPPMPVMPPPTLPPSPIKGYEYSVIPFVAVI